MTYDIVIIGGGLAGSTLASELASQGRRVLVLERETRFRDRVRGENMLPWGVAAARRLGILDDLMAAGGRLVGSWNTYAMGNPEPLRDLRTTTPTGEPCLNMYHPDLQEVLLARAARLGAEIRRGALVTGLSAEPGRPPSVTFEQSGRPETITPRLVVGADGRASQVRQWAGFEIERNPELLVIAGVLFEGCDAPDDATHVQFGPGIVSLVAPQGGRRARTYFVYPGAAGRRGLSGADKVPEFLSLCQASGAPAGWFAKASAVGPLAEFEAADRWVSSPARNGIALVGDSAAATDPSWGCGLSLTLVDVEHLANALAATDDWDAAVGRYAREHDEYYGALRRILGWLTELVWTPGPDADARRTRVFPRMAADPSGFPDSVGQGPFGPSDERARRLVLGLE